MWKFDEQKNDWIFMEFVGGIIPSGQLEQDTLYAYMDSKWHNLIIYYNGIICNMSLKETDNLLTALKNRDDGISVYDVLEVFLL